jgi:5'-deoxynucleotidase YfbR-like HD superfamily hydrolase
MRPHLKCGNNNTDKENKMAKSADEAYRKTLIANHKKALAEKAAAIKAAEKAAAKLKAATIANARKGVVKPSEKAAAEAKAAKAAAKIKATAIANAQKGAGGGSMRGPLGGGGGPFGKIR